MRTLALLITLALLGGCRSAAVSPPSRSLEVDPEGPRALRTIRTIEAAGLTGPGGTAFSVAVRTSQMTNFPCGSCHGAGKTTVATPAGGRRAHEGIVPVHPKALGSRCDTCHDPSNLERLRLQDGGTVTLDQAFMLCRQCHFQQAEDWAAGAHGKRLAGWRGRRVVMNCTDCHDPHVPVTVKRMPVEFPRIPRTTPLERLPAGGSPSTGHAPAGH